VGPELPCTDESAVIGGPRSGAALLAKPDAADALACADPSLRLVAAFRAAAARMQGLGFVNPALDVEAIGFAPWGSHWLGVMITPWFINLILAPRVAGAWESLALGAKRRYRFPAGDYEFIGAVDEIAGEYHACSLFSPVLEFDDHATARLVAQLARDALLDPANADAAPMPMSNPGREPRAADEPGPVAEIGQRLQAPLSKRGFLRGRFLGSDRDDDRR
jgi:[NiFe] hydrogenase assembly HybE family chaperone